MLLEKTSSLGVVIGSSSDTLSLQTETLFHNPGEGTVPSYPIPQPNLTEHFSPSTSNLFAPHLPSLSLPPYLLELLHLLLQDSTGIEEITIMLDLTETLAGISQLDREGIHLFTQLRELKEGRR